MAFSESVIKVRNYERIQMIWDIYIATQGGYQDIKRHTENIEPKREKGPEELLKNMRRTNGV